MTLKPGSRHRSVLVSTVSLVVLAALSGHAGGRLRAAIDADKVYFGNPQKYTRAAVLAGEKVYRRIPAYREILDRKLTRADPDYWPLLRKAGQAFRRSLGLVCRTDGYDLVAEVGSISAGDQGGGDRGGAVPDITGKVIEALEKPPPPEKPPPGRPSG